MNQSQRLTEIKKSNHCINCFSKTHTVKNCSSQHSCYRCGKRHHTMLHKEPNTHSSHMPDTNQNTVVQIHHSGQVYYARALLDSGPEGTFISSI